MSFCIAIVIRFIKIRAMTPRKCQRADIAELGLSICTGFALAIGPAWPDPKIPTSVLFWHLDTHALLYICHTDDSLRLYRAPTT